MMMLPDRPELPFYNQVSWIQIKRAVLAVYLYSFAPMTKVAITVFVCIRTCDGAGGPCTQVLAFDMGVKCYDSDHIVALVIGSAFLLAFAVILPLAILRLVHHSVFRRRVSLKLRAVDIDRWFKELDVDQSGGLEPVEVATMLRRTHQDAGRKQVRGSACAARHF
jgi:hypothetical protein